MLWPFGNLFGGGGGGGGCGCRSPPPPPCPPPPQCVQPQTQCQSQIPPYPGPFRPPPMPPPFYQPQRPPPPPHFMQQQMGQYQLPPHMQPFPQPFQPGALQLGQYHQGPPQQQQGPPQYQQGPPPQQQQGPSQYQQGPPPPPQQQQSNNQQFTNFQPAQQQAPSPYQPTPMDQQQQQHQKPYKQQVSAPSYYSDGVNSVNRHSGESKPSSSSSGRSRVNAAKITEACNSDEMFSIMSQSIIPEEVQETKRRMHAELNRALEQSAGNVDVLCWRGVLSYRIAAKMFCEVHSDDVACFAFSTDLRHVTHQ